MFDIEKEFNKIGITKEQYEQMLGICEQKVAKVTDIDWTEIIDRYKLDCASDTLRKAQQPPIFGAAFVKQYMEEKFATTATLSDDEYLESLRIAKQEIQKEKRKLYDERLDLNRRLNAEARMETTFDKIDDMFYKIGSERYISYEPIYHNGSNDMIVCLSDLHIGATFFNSEGKYNSDIAKERLNDYLAEIISVRDMYSTANCHVVLLGDNLNGSIHKTISITNKENVIEQIKIACEYIADFSYELGKYFENVIIHHVSGNHTRIDKKDDALISERLDMLIPWFIKSTLRNCDNILVEDAKDDTYDLFDIQGKKYVAVHGDYDVLTDASVAKLALWVKQTPYCVLCGHKHYPAMSDVSGIKIVQSGSLCGSGDDFTRQKRLTGKPSQTILVVNEKGIKAHIPVEL